MFTDDEPSDDIEDDLAHIQFALLACPLTSSLAPPIEDLLAELEPTRGTQTQLERAVSAEDAKVPFADDALNLLLDEAKREVPIQLDPEQAAKIMARLFEKRSPSALRRFTLGEQHETQRGWPDILTPLQNPKLTDLAHRLTQAVKHADEVLSNQARAQTELDTFLLGPRAEYVAHCNQERAALFGKILEISRDPAHGPLPSDFVDRFFLRDVSGRVKRLSDVEKTIERLSAKLGRLQAQRQAMKDKLKTTAQEKLTAEILARSAKLADAQRSAHDEAAAIAALQAKLDEAKTP